MRPLPQPATWHEGYLEGIEPTTQLIMIWLTPSKGVVSPVGKRSLRMGTSAPGLGRLTPTPPGARQAGIYYYDIYSELSAVRSLGAPAPATCPPRTSHQGQPRGRVPHPAPECRGGPPAPTEGPGVRARVSARRETGPARPRPPRGEGSTHPHGWADGVALPSAPLGREGFERPMRRGRPCPHERGR